MIKNNKNVLNECLHLARVPQCPSVKQGLNSPSCRRWAAPVSSVQDQREIWALQLSVTALGALVIRSMHAGREPSTHPGARGAVRENHSASAPLKPHLSEGFIPPCKTLKKQTGKHNDCQLFCGSIVCHVARKPQHVQTFPPSPAWRLAVSTSGLVALFPCHENRPVTSDAKMSQELQVRVLLAKTLISPDLKEEWRETYEVKQCNFFASRTGPFLTNGWRCIYCPTSMKSKSVRSHFSSI